MLMKVFNRDSSPSRRLSRLIVRKNVKVTELPREKNAVKQIKHTVNTVNNMTKQINGLSMDEKQNHSGKVHDFLAKVLLLNCNQVESTQEDDFEEKILSLKVIYMNIYKFILLL